MLCIQIKQVWNTNKNSFRATERVTLNDSVAYKGLKWLALNSWHNIMALNNAYCKSKMLSTTKEN